MFDPKEDSQKSILFFILSIIDEKAFQCNYCDTAIVV